MYLNAHSYYSLRWGTLSPEKLVRAAKAKGVKMLALTDINNTSCAFQFIRACQDHRIKPILGIEFRKAHQLLYIGLARNHEGWYQLCKFLTDHSLEKAPLPNNAPDLPDTFFVYEQNAKPLDTLRANEYLGIRPTAVHQLFNSPLLSRPDKLVILSPITFLNHEGYRIHQLLRAIDLNTLVTKLPPNAIARAEEQLYAPTELHSFYQLYPQIIHNTKRLLSECTIELSSNLKNNRQTFTGTKDGDFALLQKLTYAGLRHRYGAGHTDAIQRVDKELKMIHQLDFCCYFLITWDIIRYAASQGYHHVGRGSGANSIVAYCLYITDVEPLELDLYFERFINEYRSSPPDFDIDFSWDERDDVTDYIFKRYGREHTALLATYSTFKYKAAVREIAKALGLAKADIDQIILEPHLKDKHHHWAKYVFRYAAQIQGYPNHLSIHAGGVIISERSLHYHTALRLMPKGFPITHFDMYGAEDLHFHKYDILSQRGLGHIKDTVTLIKKNQGKAIDIHDLDYIKKDPQVRAKLSAGHCIGCFYIESPAMRGLLSKLKCEDYVHLVAASSIIRPGVAKSGMMREYIKRFHDPSRVEYLHPIFEKHLGETFGVMVYQEDVLKILYHFAGITLGEADVIRRLMKGWNNKPEALSALEHKYFRNCAERGYSDALAKEVWRQIRSFSGYSFCKAHSASFAAESFQSLYLKTYYPIEFMVAVINNFGGFYKTEYYVHEARMSGANIHAPCVNHSNYLTSLQGRDVSLGFIHLHQLQQKVAAQIVAERQRCGPFLSLVDFTKRVVISSEQLDILIRINAFRFTKKSKYELMWDKNAVKSKRSNVARIDSLFEDEQQNYSLPILEEGHFDQAFDEIELLGFPVRSPFDLLPKGTLSGLLAHDLKDNTGRVVQLIGYYVCRKDVTTVNKKHMYFGTWLDREGHFFDTVHFPNSLRGAPFRGRGCYRVLGKVVLDFGFPSVEVHRMERLAFITDARY
jgi:DNA polymerase-3 subunit alpha